MNNELIKKLTEENKGWRSPLSVSVLTALSLISFATIFTIYIANSGGLRPNLIAQIESSLPFLLEIIGIALLLVLSASIAFGITIPDHPIERISKKAIYTFSALAIILLGFLFYSLISPALAPSMAGKREFCSEEVIIGGFLIQLALITTVFRKRVHFNLLPAAMISGIFAALVPIFFMQLSCMHAPMHNLKEHFLPGVAVIFLAFLSTKLIRKK